MRIIFITIFIFFACEKNDINDNEMPRKIPDLGATYGDLSADKLRDALSDFNDNFGELYTGIAGNTFDVPIGAWDMNATATKSVDLTSYRPASDYVPLIIGVSILNDTSGANQKAYPLNFADIGNGHSSVNGSWNCNNNTSVLLMRLEGGFFDGDVNFNDSVINRGFVTVIFVQKV